MALRATHAQIVEAADRLFYEQGYAHTSFSDIADAVGISRGNFYYHFKTKDEILDAVIARRVETTRVMLARWEAEGEHPAQRIESFIKILITNQTKIMAYGCPVGTLCAELAKLDHALQDDAAGIFTLFRTWLTGQFAALGHGEDADRCAMHLLARSQGVAAMANAFHDEDFIAREVEAMCGWLAEAAQAHAGPGVHAH